MFYYIKQISGIISPNQKCILFDIDKNQIITEPFLNREIEHWNFTKYQVLGIEPWKEDNSILLIEVSITNKEWDITKDDIKIIINCLNDQSNQIEHLLEYSNCQASIDIVKKQLMETKSKILEALNLEEEYLDEED